ncbi:MAG: YajD family HNH nuclease [Desulfarculaceae bacterium]|nr:YajD family HNH nuclease [Desulfarculaceae bacterium]MCF8072355.1 YajD family HNH nuclease [Desulfarculaceae bacterium]MCF8100276.1 YajD family HNH nuclease [Desulfarculaceae bacterium]MCF8116151.1 YajD family HNH nuclease [Desulfarculaceae bacterium]
MTRTGGNWEQIREEARRNRADRERSYREKALKMFPHVCGRCGREFSGKQLSELTVHHKDSDHDNNPPDGSNWELLCIYCHDNEHQRDQVAQSYEDAAPEKAVDGGVTHQPFAALGDLLKKKS